MKNKNLIVQSLNYEEDDYDSIDISSEDINYEYLRGLNKGTLLQHISLLQLILPHMVDHTFMAFPVPLQTLWTQWTIFVPLMFPISSLKTCIIHHMRLLNLFSRIYVDMTLKPAYIGMCAKGQIVLEFL